MIDFGQLRGKTIAITGATRGIGRETAVLLSKLGANLVLGSRSAHDLLSLARGLETDVVGLPVDVSDEVSVKDFYDKALHKFGKIDALVNSAGYGVFESALSMPTEEFDRMIAVNLKGTFLCCKYFGQHMVENKEGKILNMISIAGTTALSGCAGYSASKFGALGLSKVLQIELRKEGVQVISVLPGAVDTSFWDKMGSSPDRSNMIPSDVVAKHLVYLLCQPDGAVVDEVTIMPPLGIL